MVLKPKLSKPKLILIIALLVSIYFPSYLLVTAFDGFILFHFGLKGVTPGTSFFAEIK